MRYSLVFLASLLLASVQTHASERTTEIDTYKAVFDSRPVDTPTDKTPDAPVAGNGDIGLTMCSTSEGVRFYIGKNDFWKAIEEYPKGGIALPGWLDLSCKEIREGIYHAEQLPGSACINASFSTADNTVSMKAWVAAEDNKVVIDLTSGRSTVLELGLRPCEDNVSKSAAGASDGISWAVREFKDDPGLSWFSGVAMAMNCENGKMEITPGRHVFVISVFSNFDADNFTSAAVSAVTGFDEAKADALWAEHTAWWDGFWNLSHVEIGDSFLEKTYYLSQYLFACCSHEGKFAPGLWGTFITCDDTAWAGDYHLNYNYQSPYWGCYSSNQICLTENYDRPLLDFMGKGSSYAETLFGCRGICYPVGIGPFGLATAAWPRTEEGMLDSYGSTDNKHDCGVMFWGQKSNASFGAVNMMMRFYATWDKAYAEKVYPYVKACAEFWEDWLVLENGMYVDKNDDFYECPSWDGHTGDTNPICSLGLIRMVMRGACDMSGCLGVDKTCRKKWQDILDNISPLPTYELPDGTRSLIWSGEHIVDGNMADPAGRAGLNRVMMHGILIPPGVCGPHLTPEINDMMLSSVGKWKEKRGEDSDWGNSMGNGVETVYAGAARIGYPAAEILGYLKERIAMQCFANGYIVADGGGVETLAAVPFAINEMLLQSFEGVVRVFPNWVNEQDASFETLRADGAFLVSSSLKDGEVEGVRISSEQGRPLYFANPWPGCRVKVTKNGRKVRSMSGDVLKIRTKAGQTIELLKK